MTFLDFGMSATSRRRWSGILAKMRPFLVLLVSLRLLAEQSNAAVEKPETSSSTAANGRAGVPPEHAGSWSEADELPLLLRTTIRPIKDAAEFAIEPCEIRYPREPRPPLPTEKPFEKDDDAVAAARAWITSHFGRLPQDISLEVTRIDHSSSGRPKPAFDWDQGHTIVFRALYRGLPTDSHAVIYITGRSRFGASLELHTFSPIPGTAQRIIDKAAALKAWRTRIKQSGEDAAALAACEKNGNPRLVYVWSPKANVGGNSRILAPTWALDREERFMVDGRTGIAWFND
jgi:hypothetical protein